MLQSNSRESSVGIYFVKLSFCVLCVSLGSLSKQSIPNRRGLKLVSPYDCLGLVCQIPFADSVYSIAAPAPSCNTLLSLAETCTYV